MMNATTGRRMVWRDHIGQSIADILTTPIGSRIMRRSYGSYIPQLIDQPLTPANILRLQAATAQAIMKHEPRTRLRRAMLQMGTDGRAVLTIERADKGQAGTTQQTVEIRGGQA